MDPKPRPAIGVERYLRQDAIAAHDLYEKAVLQKGDLVIRDLGYAVIDAFEGIARKEAFFLSRLHSQWSIYAEDGSGKLDLLALLEQMSPLQGNRFRLKVAAGDQNDEKQGGHLSRPC